MPLVDLIFHEVIAIVMTEWLSSWNELLSFDMAMTSNSSLRPHFLFIYQLLHFDSFHHLYRKGMEKLVWKINYDHPNRTVHFFSWIVQREMKLSHLFVFVRHIPNILLRLPRLHLKHVHQFSLFSFEEDDVDFDAEVLQTFLSAFPNLEVFNGSRWSMMTDSHLLAFTKTSSSLTSFKMDYCTTLSCSAIVNMVKRYSTTLLELRCVAVDDWTLHEIASTCSSLKKIAISCDRLSSIGLVNFCAAYPHLQELTLRWNVMDRPCPITDTVLCTIAQSCPQLQIINTQQCVSTTSGCFNSLIQYCSALREIRLPVFDCSIESLTNLTRLCKVSFSRQLDYRAAYQFLHHCSLLITHFYGPLNLNALLLLAQKHGQQLIEVDCQLQRNINEEHLSHFLSLCPNLKSFLHNL